MARPRPVGVITRGTTNPNRLRRCDRWIAATQAQRLRRHDGPPIVVDLGYGASPVTALELHDRLRVVRAEHVEVRAIGECVDLVEDEHRLPGVDPDRVEAAIDGADLVVAGSRVLPPQLQTATIHRLELPQGRFERRVPLPPGRYDRVARAEVHGCLVVTLQKVGAARG